METYFLKSSAKKSIWEIVGIERSNFEFYIDSIDCSYQFSNQIIFLSLYFQSSNGIVRFILITVAKIIIKYKLCKH